MIRFILTLALATNLTACQAKAPVSKESTVQIVSSVTHPEWSKDAVIYQINTRQYSEAGNFAAVEADLDRIKSLGVDILWFMPIHPIGEEKRKGSLGSPYAVKDFQAVNPDLGTIEDFKSLVDAAHAQDMKVIIDWVANHTAWDNSLMTDHPEYYTRNAEGEMQHPPDTDWYDVADLDYSQEGLRDYMSESLLYWVRDVGIDGYRCDVAGMVPTDFWNSVRPKLDAIKPVFMLAEWQEPELHEKAFDASYAWRWKEIMQDIVNGKADVSDIEGYYADTQSGWPEDAMRMVYTSNHDQNTWDGTPDEIYGKALQAAMVLSFTGEGIPLIYNGQEAGNDKRLEFFEKDLIRWQDHSNENLLKSLVQLKTENQALWNGAWGGRTVKVESDKAKQVLSFIRVKDENRVFVVINLSEQAQSARFVDDFPSGQYTDYFSGKETKLTQDTQISMPSWGFKIYVRK